MRSTIVPSASSDAGAAARTASSAASKNGLRDRSSGQRPGPPRAARPSTRRARKSPSANGSSTRRVGAFGGETASTCSAPYTCSRSFESRVGTASTAGAVVGVGDQSGGARRGEEEEQEPQHLVATARRSIAKGRWLTFTSSSSSSQTARARRELRSCSPSPPRCSRRSSTQCTRVVLPSCSRQRAPRRVAARRSTCRLLSSPWPCAAATRARHASVSNRSTCGASRGASAGALPRASTSPHRAVRVGGSTEPRSGPASPRVRPSLAAVRRAAALTRRPPAATRSRVRRPRVGARF